MPRVKSFWGIAMSLKKVSEVKADKGFKIWDLIVYGAVVLIIAVIFLAVFLTKDTSPLKGVKIYSDEALVFEYNFTSGEYKNSSPESVTVESGENLLKIKVTANGGYNLIEIDTNERAVKVTEADCGKRDCVYTSAIVDNGGMIYCSPHKLRILPFDFEADDTIII